MSIPTIEAAAASERSFRRAKRTVLLAITGVVAGLLLFIVWREMYGEKFTISKETTYITEPLREDGLPDYAAALDALASEGVTPENNAAVLYWQAFGPNEVPQSIRQEFFQRIGTSPPPPSRGTGDYLLSLSAFAGELEARSPTTATMPIPEKDEIEVTASLTERIFDRMERAENTPWSAEEDPELTDWILRNEKPLRLIVEATHRPCRYQPLFVVPEDGRQATLHHAFLPWVQSDREAARLLCVRAMQRLHDGDIADAQDDLLACHRLARHAASGPWLIDWLIGVALDANASEADIALAHHAAWSSAQATAYRERLAALPPFPPLAEKFDRAERFAMLDTIVSVARYGMERVGFDPFNTPAALPTLLVHWDAALYKANALSDLIVAAAAESDPGARRRRVGEVQRAYGEFAAAAGLHSRQLSDRSGLAADRLLSHLAPAAQAALDRELEPRSRADLMQVAFALSAYRADHGSYPATLDELAPRYIDAVPPDLFTGKPPIYRPKEGGGYVLYSVGHDATDNGGLSRADASGGDDIVIRTPQPEATP